MGTADLQAQIASLERGIVGKRAGISQAEAQLSRLEEARACALNARDESQALIDTTTYFALASWAGVHAEAFMDAVSGGGCAREAAVRMQGYCTSLVECIDGRISSLRDERAALLAGITADERAIGQARRSILRLRMGR